jgi:TRAP-type C4-dicarboxylate transport system permease small subunit
MKPIMTLDIVTKGIPFLHLAVVAVMVFAGVPRIFSYTALIWGGCAIMSISLTEEDIYLKIPALWRYRHLFALGVCLWISQSV